MPRSFLLALALVSALFVVFGLPACSSSSCDDSKCAAGNKCIDDGVTGTKCRLQCSAQTCPLNYHCTQTPDGKTSFCAADKIKYAASQYGQWGHNCIPTGGLDNNPDCDADQSFWCYGTNPSDGNAYCTQYQCNDDSECAGGFYCGKVNLQPSVTSAKRTYGADKTTSVCLKREYCSPCKIDLDCPTQLDGQPVHCVAGSDGAKFCTKECSKDANCAFDATCADNGAAGAKVCTPRAGTCKGDGSLCSPCRSDADCPNGFCIEQGYSHEHYCTVKSPTPCQVVDNKLQSGCPPAVRGTETKVYCATSNDFLPQDQCFGIVQFGSDNNGPSYIDGCWTPSRL